MRVVVGRLVDLPVDGAVDEAAVEACHRAYFEGFFDLFEQPQGAGRATATTGAVFFDSALDAVKKPKSVMLRVHLLSLVFVARPALPGDRGNWRLICVWLVGGGLRRSPRRVLSAPVPAASEAETMLLHSKSGGRDRF